MAGANRLVGALVGLVIAPLGAEYLIAYVKGERYSMPRALLIVGCALVVIAITVLMHRLSRRVRLLLEALVGAVGLVIAGVGVAAIALGPTTATLSFAILVTALGLLTFTLGAYSIYVDRSGADFLFAIDPNRQLTIPVTASMAGSKHIARYPSFDLVDQEVLNLCVTAVDPEIVHFVAYYVKGECRFHVDTFDDSSLNRFFRSDSRDSRRQGMEVAGRQLEWILSRLNPYTRKLNSGVLIRIVLDVEDGALYYYRIDRNAYLVGATLDQLMVLACDERLRKLANRIGPLPRGDVVDREFVPQVE